MVQTVVSQKMPGGIERVSGQIMMRLPARIVPVQKPNESHQRPARLPVAALVQRAADIFPEHHGRRFRLPPCRIVTPPQLDDVGDPALKTVKRVHDGDCRFSGAAVALDRHHDLDDACFELPGPNAEDMAQKVDFDVVPIDVRQDSRRFGGSVAGKRIDNRSDELLRKLFGGRRRSEIVDVLGRVGAILRQLGGARI